MGSELFQRPAPGSPEAVLEPGDDVPASTYLAEDGSSRVALPAGSELVAGVELSDPVEHVAATPEERRVHAVTASEVVTLRFGSLDGVKTTEFPSTLDRAGLGDAGCWQARGRD